MSSALNLLMANQKAVGLGCAPHSTGADLLTQIRDNLLTRLVCNAPELFDVDYIVKPSELGSREVKTYKVLTHWEFEDIRYNQMSNEEIVHAIVDELVEKVEIEFRSETKRLAASGEVICWYTPVHAFLHVNPDTFDPCIHFTSRYAVEKRRVPITAVFMDDIDKKISIRNKFDNYPSLTIQKIVRSINERLLKEHPILFPVDRFISFDEPDYRGRITTLIFKTRWTFKSTQDYSSLNVDLRKAMLDNHKERLENEIIDAITLEILAEIRNVVSALKPDETIRWYIPVFSCGVIVDPASFQPVVRFASKYTIEKR